MHLVLYEWCCSGGLHSPAAAPILDQAPAESLLTEGRLMLEALAEASMQLRAAAVTVLVDANLPDSVAPRLPSGCTRHAVATAGDLTTLLAQAATATQVLVVAPETNGILGTLVSRLEQAGLADRLAGGSAGYVMAASDKQVTCDLLAAAGVPVPAGRSLEPGASLPTGFCLPAIQKARCSAGGDGLQLIPTTADFVPPATPTRLEAQVPGIPVGVCCLCGPTGVVPLLPLAQRFAAGPAPIYGGGEPLAAALRPRATSLALRAITAIERATQAPVRGWVGVDMILGDRKDGRADRVLEVNPRLTTSFVGLTQGYAGGLLAPLLAQAAGHPVHLGSCCDDACQFLLSP